MLVVVRFDPPEDLDDFVARAERALAAFAACPGHQRGWLARSTDEPETWVLCTLWDSVGVYRRALSAYDVKLHAHPLMYAARDEVSAFETVLESGPGGVRALGTDRADDATSTAIGDFGPRGPGNPPAPGTRPS